MDATQAVTEARSHGYNRNAPVVAELMSWGDYGGLAGVHGGGIATTRCVWVVSVYGPAMQYDSQVGPHFTVEFDQASSTLLGMGNGALLSAKGIGSTG